MAPTQRGSPPPSHLRQLQQVLEAHWGGPVSLALRHYAPELLKLAELADAAGGGAALPTALGHPGWRWAGMGGQSATECRRLVAFVRGELRRMWGRG